tara:strand:+ start:520 stop:663 length:144 start_codon:yes stop_codon:yes gene_type:complete
MKQHSTTTSAIFVFAVRNFGNIANTGTTLTRKEQKKDLEKGVNKLER